MDKISVIDLLSDVSNIDYKKEFAKLKDMLLERKVYGNAEEMYTIESFFNKYISEWRYRGTAVNLKEIYEKIGLLYSLSYIKNEETIIINLLTLIDLILNIELFCNDIIKKLNEKRYEYEEWC